MVSRDPHCFVTVFSPNVLPRPMNKVRKVTYVACLLDIDVNNKTRQDTELRSDVYKLSVKGLYKC